MALPRSGRVWPDVGLSVLISLAVVAMTIAALRAWRQPRVLTSATHAPGVMAYGQTLERVRAAYLSGDLAGVQTLLETTKLDLNTVVAMWTAVGRYEKAVAAAHAAAPHLFALVSTSDPGTSLVRINLAEALVELGQFDEALALLALGSDTDWPLTRVGAATARAWALTMAGRHDEALTAAHGLDASALGHDYAAELPLTLALVHLNLGQWARAKAALDDAARLTVRASTERNGLLHRARWALETGDVGGAQETWRAVQGHRWKGQGGAGLLALGDAFARQALGDEARAAWALAVSQDGESLSAATARERLG